MRLVSDVSEILFVIALAFIENTKCQCLKKRYKKKHFLTREVIVDKCCEKYTGLVTLFRWV